MDVDEDVKKRLYVTSKVIKQAFMCMILENKKVFMESNIKILCIAKDAVKVI